MPYKNPTEANKRRRQWTLERNRVYMKAWHTINKEWANLNRILRKRGMTLDQFHARYESQDFQCAICKKEEFLVVDHDHGTGRVRGLLCNSCNTGLGFFRDSRLNLQSADAYMSRV